MMKINYFVALIICVSLSACSFTSQQYSFAKSMMTENKNDSSPKASWVMSFNGESFELFAVNDGDSVYFVNEEIFINFNGWEVIQIRYLEDEDKSLSIEIGQQGYSYYLGNQFLAGSLCGSWIMDSPEKGSLREYTRSCKIDNELYDNEITLNSESQLIELVYKIHPNKQSIKLSHKESRNNL